MAPGLGLYLDEVFFENYNKCQAKQAAEHSSRYPSHGAIKAPCKDSSLSNANSSDGVDGKAGDENDNEPVRFLCVF